MRRIAAVVLAWTCLAGVGEARAELKSSRKAESFRKTVGERLCYAGRFRFDSRVPDRDVYLGHFVEQMPSHAGHPNAEPWDGSAHVVLLGNEDFKPEVGKTYCLILTAGSKRGMTVEGFGPDDEATAKELKALIGSPSAFENDPTWVQRRALWARFRKDLGADERPLLYAEDDALQNILYLKGGATDFPLHLYSARSGKSEPIVHAKVLPGVNRITFDKGYFRVWHDGSIELNIGTGREE